MKKLHVTSVLRLAIVAISLFALLAGNTALAQGKPSRVPRIKPVIGPDNHKFGFIPPPIDMSHINKYPPRFFGKMGTPPAAYDWRTTSKVTPVKNQDGWGLCWMFGNTGGIESRVLIDESTTFDFSEQEAYNCYQEHDVSIDCVNGGNSEQVAFYYGVAGTSNESCHAFADCGTYGTCHDCPLIKQVTGFQEVNGQTPDTAAIKDAVYNIGPVMVSVWASSSLFQNYTSGVLDSTSVFSSTNHLVLIVGYDDAMAHPHNGSLGGWIVKNSWGTGWGESGYFRIAYGTYNIGSWASVYSGYRNVKIGQSTMTYEKDYTWGQVGWDGHDWGAVIFNPTITGTITHIGLYANANNTSYTIKVYDNWNSGSPTSQLGTTQTGTAARAGYYAVLLTTPIAVTSGNDFVVIIEYTTPSYTYDISYDSKTPYQTNKSYVSDTGANGSWSALDAGNWNYGNIAIRAIIVPPTTDTDSDGLPDFWENQYSSCMKVAVSDAGSDYDSDGLTNLQEYNNSTNPCVADTDGGGENDGSEVNNGRDPLDANDDSHPATYDSGFHAPRCTTGISPCVVDAVLIDSRDTMSGKSEPHQPNVLGTCADGTSGTYHTYASNSSSLDSFKVTDLKGTTFQPGDTVRLDARVFCIYTNDRLFVWQADNASSPSWTFKASTPCTSWGVMETLSVTFKLGNVTGDQGIRAGFYYNTSATPGSACENLGYNEMDRDDVVLHVNAAVTCTSVAIDQADPFSLAELASQAFTATCTMSDLTTQNCTSSAVWSTTGNVTNVTNTVTGSHVACAAGGTGTVTATVSTCTTPSHMHNITVTNDDVQTAVACTPDSVNEGASGALTCNAVYGSDTCQSVSGTCTVGGAAHCGGTTGNYSIAQVCGNDKPANCTITCGSFTDTLIVNDNGDTISGITACPGPWTDNGSANAYTCTYHWSDGLDCNDSNDICTSASTVTGGCTGSNGSATCANVCGNDNPPDATLTAATKTCTITVNDRGDTISGITACPGPWTDNGSANAYTCTYHWASGCDGNDSNDICTSASTVTGGCSGSNGSATCANVCGNDDPPDATLTAATKTCNIVVNDRGDTISGITACPGPWTDNGSANAYTCTYHWSSGCDGNDSNDICTSASTVTGGCTGGNGTGTCASVCGNDNPPDATLTAATKTCNIVVNDKGDTISSITACPGPWTDTGVANAYTCTYTWSSGQSCNDSNDICTTASVISGGCTGGNGSGTCAKVCGNGDPPDATLTAATKTCNIAVNDKGDTITGLSNCPATWQENRSSQAYTCTYHWSDGLDCNQGTNICTTQSTLSPAGVCTGGAGTYTTLNVCGNANPPDCTITAQTKTCVVDVIDDGDVVTSNDITPNPGSLYEGATLQFHLTQHWNDGCAIDLTNSATWSSAAGCGTIAAATGLYTAPADDGLSIEPRCTDTVSTTSPTSGPVNVTVHNLVTDSDGDGLSDAIEGPYCTDPLLPDSDGDNLCDGGNSAAGCVAGEDMNNNGIVDPGETNPCDPDSDHDGLSDGAEKAAGLDPLKWDTDGDGMPDGFEANSGGLLNPLNGGDGALDQDSDKISNVNEYWNRSPFNRANPVGYGAIGDNRSFWGDSGAGDGLVGPEDLSVMRSLVAGDFSYMATLKFYNVIPTSGHTLDLDPEGLFAATDLSIVRDMLAGRNCNYVGSMPTALELDLSSPPASSVQVGSTTHIGVKVKAQTSGKYMTGASVIFKIDTVLSKGRATIFGGDGPGMDHPDYGKYRWDQVGKLQSGDSSVDPARVMLRMDAAGTVVIKIYKPQVGISGQGRYMPALTLTDVQIKGTL